MITKKVRLSLLTISWLTIVPATWANQLETENLGKSGYAILQFVDTTVDVDQPVTQERSLSKKTPASTVEDWMAQIEASQAEITGVNLEQTTAGLQVTLETTDGTLVTPGTTVSENTLVAEIPNAVLKLLGADAFEQANPVPGIMQVSVTNLPGDQVRVAITGRDAPPTAEVTSTASGLMLTVTPVAADTAQEDTDVEITVTAERSGSDYFIPEAGVTRTSTPIFDTPASIQIVPEKVIEDQGATNVKDILRNVSGVNFSTASGGRSEDFIIRGFNSNQFRNGFRDDFFSSRTETELANIDRVEVLKGPASVLFGRADPSGIINFVTKKPLSEPLYELSFTAGSFDFYRPTLDFSGPLTEDGNLAYRLNAAYENAGSFREGVQTERFFIAPTLSWQISPDTKLGLEFSYLNDTRPVDRGLVILNNNKVANIPFSTFLGDPEVREDFEETRTELYLDHRFNPNLSLRSFLRYTTATESGPGGTSQIVGDSIDDRNFPVSEFRGDQFYETFTLQNDLIGKFNTGPLKHTVLFGLEYTTRFNSFEGSGRASGLIDIFNPSAFNPLNDGPFNPFDPSEDRDDTFGIYLQDQIEILDNLQLVLGGRFETFSSESENLATGEISETNADAFSPRIGIVYQPIEPISLYASYTRSFNPVGGTDINAEPFKPQRGTGYEIGIKTEIVKDRLFSTLAFYDTTLTNITTPNPDNNLFDIQTGEQNSKGVELDISGEIIPGWNIFAGYAYTDAKITEDNTFPVGNRLNNVPEHKFNLWTTYTLQKGSLEGLGFGLGVFYFGNRAGDLENSFFADDYTRIDAAIFYEKKNYRFALNFKNLFDAEFLEGTQSRRQVAPGAPFTVQGTVSIKF